MYTTPNPEDIRVHLDATKYLRFHRSCLINLRGIRLEVSVSCDRALWVWMDAENLDRLGWSGSPGQRMVASSMDAYAFIQDFGIGDQKQAMLEHLERFMPFLAWLDLQEKRKALQAEARANDYEAREAVNAPWFTASLRGVRHPFSFLANGAIWTLATQELIDRLGLECKPGRWIVATYEKAEEWIQDYILPSQQEDALRFLRSLVMIFPVETAPVPTMEITNVEGQKERIEDMQPTRELTREYTA